MNVVFKLQKCALPGYCLVSALLAWCVVGVAAELVLVRLCGGAV